MGDLKDLADSMRQRAANVALNAPQLTRLCALAIDASVVLATPVDTGRARANWQVEIGTPADGVIGDPTNPKETFDVSGQTAISEGQKVINSYQGGSSINITNNLAYIGRLNSGWSKQAPAGFVERSIQIGVAAIQKRAQSMTEKPT